jgi:plastocyanin
MKRNNYPGMLLLLFAIGSLHISCSKEEPDNYNGNAVAIKSTGFVPAELRTTIGIMVTWTNTEAGAGHSVTADDGSFDSGDMLPGATFNHTFTAAGTYLYHCMHHAAETGKVIVKASQ